MRYARRFAALRQRGEGAFVPFLVLGDPDAETSLRLVEMLVASGADALELGIPFSDPIADGPVIQAAVQRALASGTTPSICFALLASVRQRFPDLPLGLLVYANLVIQETSLGFYQRAARAGADSVLVADVPSVEASPFVAAARAANVEPVLMVPPNATEETVRRVATLGQGYTYLVGRPGVTGAEVEARRPAAPLIRLLEQHHAPPPLLGFGVSTPEHARAALAAGAAGVIVGSALIAHMTDHLDSPQSLHTAVTDFARAMKAGTRIAALGHASSC
jgi:tryptophan synthase alpha chain